MKTILIVDDDRLFRWAIKEALEGSGYRVLEAENGRQAREHLRSGVELTLLDRRLSDCTGFALLDEIATAGPGYPVVILTAHPTDEEESEARRLGAQGYLAKPDDPFEIVDTVQATLSHA